MKIYSIIDIPISVIKKELCIKFLAITVPSRVTIVNDIFNIPIVVTHKPKNRYNKVKYRGRFSLIWCAQRSLYDSSKRMVFAYSSSIQGSDDNIQPKPIKKDVIPNIKKGITVRLCNNFGFIAKCLS